MVSHRSVWGPAAPRKAAGPAARVFRSLVLLLSLGLLLPQPLAADAAIPGTFCGGPQSITGVGSSTQLPVHLGWFMPNYQAACPEATGQIAYQALGDSKGAKAASEHDMGPNPLSPFTFYASDLPLSTAEYYTAYFDLTSPFRPRSFADINHLPAFVNGFAVAYNLSSCDTSKPLLLTKETLSLIYSGTITSWNHVKLRESNPHLAGCTLPVRVSVRADEAGSSIVFKDYLSRANPVFEVYKRKELNTIWPPTLTVSCRGIGEAGMADCIGTPGAISYVEYQEAASRGLPMAQVEYLARTFIGPSADPVNHGWPDNCAPTAASARVLTTTSPDWSAFSMTGSTTGYPICSYTYIFVFKKMMHSYSSALTTGQIRNTVDYMTVIASDGAQDGLTSFGYVPIPSTVRTTVRQGIDAITWF